MSAPFAALQQTANATVMATLANAVAQVGGAQVRVIFDQPYSPAFDVQIDSALPECVGASVDLASVQRGDSIEIDGATFHVERVEPDGSGLTRLVLAPGD